MSGFEWRWDLAWGILPDLLRGLVTTLECVLVGMVVALAVGLLWTVLRRSRSRWISWPAGAFVEFVRGTPLLVQLFLLYVILPGWLSPFVSGFLALGLHYSTYTSEVYRAGIDGIPRGQWEAAKALDLTRLQTYRYVILPQAIPPVIPALGNYLIAMFKDSPLLLAIGVMEILNVGYQIGGEKFNYVVPLTVVGVIYLVLALVSETFVGYLERKFRVVR